MNGFSLDSVLLMKQRKYQIVCIEGMATADITISVNIGIVNINFVI